MAGAKKKAPSVDAIAAALAVVIGCGNKKWKLFERQFVTPENMERFKAAKKKIRDAEMDLLAISVEATRKYRKGN